MSYNSNIIKGENMNQKSLVYGIKYIKYNEPITIDSPSEINERFTFLDDLIIYTPKAQPMNIFFKNPSDAIMVAKYYNSIQEEAHFSFFEMPGEEYVKIKNTIDDKCFECFVPEDLYKKVKLNLYNSANEYFISLKYAKEENLEK